MVFHISPSQLVLQKLFSFETPPASYSCDAAVIDGFDYRFDLVTRKYLKRRGIETPDRIKVAGGVKELAALEGDPEIFIRHQLRTSACLHSTRRVLLMAHSDCGAYGGWAAFNGNLEAEAQHHWADLMAFGAWRSRLNPA